MSRIPRSGRRVDRPGATRRPERGGDARASTASSRRSASRRAPPNPAAPPARDARRRRRRRRRVGASSRARLVAGVDRDDEPRPPRRRARRRPRARRGRDDRSGPSRSAGSAGRRREQRPDERSRRPASQRDSSHGNAPRLSGSLPPLQADLVAVVDARRAGQRQPGGASRAGRRPTSPPSDGPQPRRVVASRAG